jgi:hypothetical protein
MKKAPRFGEPFLFPVAKTYGSVLKEFNTFM